MGDDSKTENLPQGLREGNACGETVRPNLYGTREGSTRALQETHLARRGIPSPSGDREEVKIVSCACLLVVLLPEGMRWFSLKGANSPKDTTDLAIYPGQKGRCDQQHKEDEIE